MQIYPTELKGPLIIELSVYEDQRGFFTESYHERKSLPPEIKKPFVQDNHSRSIKNVLRGLHYQLHYSQAKLVYVVRGEIFDVAVDIRQNSVTFGKWTGLYLSEKNHRQLFIPEGFAHGFCVLSEEADVIYKCTNFYTSGDEHGIRWDDPQIGIDWPIKSPVLSPKDAVYPFLSQKPKKFLP